MSILSQVPTAAVDAVRTVLARLVAPSTTPLLPFIPKYIKVLFLLLMVANSSSWPFLWHLRVWYHPVRAIIRSKVLGRDGYWKVWRNEYEQGGSLLKLRSKIWRVATFDDCDYNMHLSNSCYAKNSDSCKMKICIDGFAPIFVTGIHMALGASHWQYMKEIPMGSRYLIETRVAGWGEKWMYLVTDFVIYPRKGSKPAARKPDVADKETVIPSISEPPTQTPTPASGASGITPLPAGMQSPSESGANFAELVQKMHSRTRAPRTDGGVVACTAVTEYCFKQGRITVPPRIAMYLAMLSPSEENRRSAHAILTSKDHGAAFTRGGWKRDPAADVLGTDVALGPDGTQEWAHGVRRAMEDVSQGLAGF